MKTPEIQLIETPNGHQHTQKQKGKTTWAQKVILATNENISVGLNYQMVDYFKNKKTISFSQTK